MLLVNAKLRLLVRKVSLRRPLQAKTVLMQQTSEKQRSHDHALAALPGKIYDNKHSQPKRPKYHLQLALHTLILGREGVKQIRTTRREEE